MADRNRTRDKNPWSTREHNSSSRKVILDKFFNPIAENSRENEKNSSKVTAKGSASKLPTKGDKTKTNSASNTNARTVDKSDKRQSAQRAKSPPPSEETCNNKRASDGETALKTTASASKASANISNSENNCLQMQPSASVRPECTTSSDADNVMYASPPMLAAHNISDRSDDEIDANNRRSRSREKRSKSREKRSRSRDSGRMSSEHDGHQNKRFHADDSSVVAALLDRISQLERAQVSQSDADNQSVKDTQNDDRVPYSDTFDLGESSDNSDHDGQDDDFDMEDLLLEGTEKVRKGQPLKANGLMIAQNFFDKEPDDAGLKVISERYFEPENCTNLSGKSLNPELKNRVPKSVRSRDINMKIIQQYVAAGATANLRLIDTITDLVKGKKLDRGTGKSLIATASDSAKLLSKSYGELSLTRKKMLKPFMGKRYSSLGIKRTYGDTLFGPDLAKEIKAIDEESKLMRGVGRGFNSYQRPEFRGSKNGYQRGRGQFRPQYNSGRGQWSHRGRGKPNRPAEATSKNPSVSR